MLTKELAEQQQEMAKGLLEYATGKCPRFFDHPDCILPEDPWQSAIDEAMEDDYPAEASDALKEALGFDPDNDPEFLKIWNGEE